MQKHRQAFTLVELIVVITILAILGTIAFISMQGYSKDSRDSVRISDLSSMKTSLELFNLDAGKYPETTNGFTVTYSGGEVWTQGIFGTGTFNNVGKLDSIPTDPLTEKEYTYSVTKTKQEYQFGGIAEGDSIGFNSILTNQTNAGNIEMKALVVGNYNGAVLKTLNGVNCTLLSIPSIISNQPNTITDLVNILSNTGLVYNGYKNLPNNYRESKYNTEGGFNFSSNKLVTYSDNNNCKTLKDDSSIGEAARTILLTNLKSAYLGTSISSKPSISKYVDVNLGNSSEVNLLSSVLVNNNFGGKIIIKKIVSQSPYFISQIGTNVLGKSYGESIVYDSLGNIYVTGLFKGDITIGTDTYTSAGDYDIFLAKYDSKGNYKWGKIAGGLLKDVPFMTTIDSNNNLYMLGRFQDTNTNIFGTNFTSSGSYDMFLTKFDLDGNVLLNKKAGGLGDDRVKGIVVANDGNIYITGQYNGTSNIFGLSIVTPDTNSDSFVAKLDTSLNSIWVKGANSLGSDWGNSIDVNNVTGDLYVAGSFGANMNLYGTGITTYGSGDSYLLKMNNAGTLQWIRTSGGIGYEESENIIIDNNGDILFTGWFRGTSATLFGSGVTSPLNGSRNDTYVSKLDSNGVLLWNSLGMGPGNDYGQKLAIDNSGNIYSVGSVGIGTNSLFGQSVTTTDEATYISKLDSNGNAIWSKTYGNFKIRDDYADIKFDGVNLYLLGGYEGTTTILGENLTSGGINEVFFTKMKNDGSIN